MSTHDQLTTRWTPSDTVAGFLATLSILASALALVYRPVRILPFAIVLALIAATMSARNQRLAGWAIVAAVVCWTLGMTIAVVTENPLW
jgi:Co/Zn/Cd efflux system component